MPANETQPSKPVASSSSPPASPSPTGQCNPIAADDVIACPVHRVKGVEKKQKWFCPVCGMLLQTCCD